MEKLLEWDGEESAVEWWELEQSYCVLSDYGIFKGGEAMEVVDSI